MNKAIEKLNAFIEKYKAAEINKYTEWYKNSKFYTEPTIKEIFNDYIGSNIESLLKAINNDEDIHNYIKVFEDMAHEFGNSWYDEDLCIIRSGWEWETMVSIELRNIVAESLGIELVDYHDFYDYHYSV